MAQKCGVTEKSIEKYTATMRKKLHAKTREHAVAIGITRGLIKI